VSGFVLVGCWGVGECDLPDGLSDCHYEWSAEIQLQYLVKAGFLIVAAPPARLAALFAELGCSLLEQGRGVCFLEKDGKDQGNGRENEGDPAHPSPAQIFSDEASNDRTNDYTR
jgi:hypothetical protein